jgi:hypothetical protein
MAAQASEKLQDLNCEYFRLESDTLSISLSSRLILMKHDSSLQ